MAFNPALVESQSGKAKIFGLYDSTDGVAATVVTLVGAATITLHDGDLDDDFKLIEDPDQFGNTETLFAYDQKYNVTINFSPNGATRAAAKTSGLNMLPAKITKVVLAHFPLAHYNGNYNYIGGGTVKATREGMVIMGLKLRAYLLNRASLTGSVIAT